MSLDDSIFDMDELVTNRRTVRKLIHSHQFHKPDNKDSSKLMPPK